jgi:hypothetical protein
MDFLIDSFVIFFHLFETMDFILAGRIMLEFHCPQVPVFLTPCQ